VGYGSGWLATLAGRIVHDAPLQMRDALCSHQQLTLYNHSTMSARIEQTVEVLEEMWHWQAILGKFRERAVPVVAKRHNVNPNTIHDKLVRQLAPHVKDAVGFDRLVARWLGGDHKPLRTALLAHAVDEADRSRVEAFFRDRTNTS
jgi:hypothetical protein